MTQTAQPVLRAKEVPPVLASLKMQVLPAIVMKVVLGGVTESMPSGMKLAFEDDVFVLNHKDFELVSKVAEKVKVDFPKELTSSKFLDLVSLSQKYLAEEIFRPGTVKVIYYPVSAEGSGFYRCILPTLYLNRGEKVTAHSSVHKTAREAMWYDVVVIQMDHSKATHLFVRTLKEMGKKVVFEFDDDFAALEPWHACYEKYRQPETQAEIAEMLRLADAVTVTTPALKKAYEKRTRRVEVIPNYIPLDDWPKAEPHGTNEFRILWAGSPSHFGDLEVVSEALWSFLRERNRAKVVFFGRAPKRIPDDIRSRIETIPFSSFAEYPHRLADVKADVAIAPLSNTIFNVAKSNIKLLEYGACGYPIIASNVGPYSEAMMSSLPKASPWVVTPDGWLSALNKFYDNPDFRAEAAENALEYARRHDVGRNIGRVEEFFTSL